MSTATKPTIPIDREYPCSDGKPMADHDLQWKWIVVIKVGLEVQYDPDPDVYVAGNLLWYPVEGNPKIRGAPDVFVALGRPKGIRSSYLQWREGNIAPQVVFEVMSPGNRRAEMARKFVFYEQYGVEEYYVYNPFNGALDGWLRRGDRLEKVADMRGFVSPRLGIRFEPGPGGDNLTIIDRAGRIFNTPLEKEHRLTEAEERAESAEERAESAEERAESAEERAESAEERAESAEDRAARYAAKLRELGIEPD